MTAARRVRFVFVIPLKARSVSASWAEAEENLRRTVRSARRSGKGEPTIVVACHDEPDLRALAGPDLHLVEVPFPQPSSAWEGGRDKASKRRFAAAWLREEIAAEEFYAMFLDADDLVHRDVVSYVLSTRADSYLIRAGYVVDLTRRIVRRRRDNFHLVCGSSFVCRFARSELPSSWDDLEAPFSQFGASPDQRGHQEYHQVASELGRPPTDIPFPAAAYVVNHGESLWSAKGRGLRPLGGPSDILMPWAGRDVLRAGFAAEDLADSLAGYAGTAGITLRAAAGRVRTRSLRLAGVASGGRVGGG